MFGYIDKKQARAIGFTHQGCYYGIPLWITHSDRPMIVAKWYPMEFLISVLQFADKWTALIFFPSRTHQHQLTSVKVIDD